MEVEVELERKREIHVYAAYIVEWEMRGKGRAGW